MASGGMICMPWQRLDFAVSPQSPEYAEKEGLRLPKAPDSINEGAADLTIAEAEAIASDDPDLIWLDVPENEYHGDRVNMEPER